MKSRILIICIMFVVLFSLQSVISPDVAADALEDAMIYISRGTFMMGAPISENCRGDDETQHSVTLSRGMYIHETEVTQALWVDVMGSNPSYNVGDQKPVDSITWYEACAFCNRLSMQYALSPVYFSDPGFTEIFDPELPVTNAAVYWNYANDGFRLPTEAEWEYACRAGSTSGLYTDSEVTHCEDACPNVDTIGWYYHNSDGLGSHDVKGKLQNNWEIWDMSGNIAEFCWDTWQPYPDHSDMDPKTQTSKADVVVRGGHSDEFAGSLRSASRASQSRGERSSHTGFRIVRNRAGHDCETLGVFIAMYSHIYYPGSHCACRLYMCNPNSTTLNGIYVWCILDVYGMLFYAPDFSTTPNTYIRSIEPGISSIEIIADFNWPNEVGTAHGIWWYAGLTNWHQNLVGNYDMFEFGWDSATPTPLP